MFPKDNSVALNPCKAGIGLRKDHFGDIKDQEPEFGFLEIHPENYFGSGPHQEKLEYFASVYPLSIHAVGLSLGSYEKVSTEHLRKLKRLVDKFNPAMVSDHASWSLSGNAHSNDLLPLPYTKESLQALCDNVKRTQDFLSRQILVENPSTYLNFKSTMTEYEFMGEVSNKTGCGILLDLNNMFVNFKNHNNCPYKYIDAIDGDCIGEVHLAGHSIKQFGSEEIRVDTHSKPVCYEVWDLYKYLVNTKGLFPTLIEWDLEIPQLNVLISEANKANLIMNQVAKNDAA